MPFQVLNGMTISEIGVPIYSQKCELA